jgi:dipeptidyl aminopeptidase/acylaminoacyl peptidase
LCVGAVDGRRRLWRMSATSGAITLLDVDGSAASVTVSENEALVVRSAVDCPPEVVAVKLYAGDPGEIVYAPATAARPPGRLERQEWRDEDGTAWQAWLCLPGEEPATPLPVLVWCHGGPMLSWTDWSWRWNPWPFVADGHAVLMIDPPLSLGYGKQTIARGWGHWLTEVARVAVGQVRGLIGRDARLDSSRIATMGASFGGWLSIALATLMPEVRLVAAHAGWADVAGVARTCDLHWHWLREYGPPSGPNYARETPQLDNIHPSCRLLLSHGVQDGHVPVHEVFGVQRALTTRGVDVRLMILPDEGHSIRRPANAAAWFRWVRRACAEMWGTGR